MAGAGSREGCQNVGRRGGFEQGLQGCFSRGWRKDFAVCEVDVSGFGPSFGGRVANSGFWTCYFAKIMMIVVSRGSYRASYASA